MYVGWSVTERQSTTPAAGFVRFRTMEQKIGVQRDLACLQTVVDEMPVLFDIFDRLIQDVVFFGIARTERHRTKMM